MSAGYSNFKFGMILIRVQGPNIVIVCSRGLVSRLQAVILCLMICDYCFMKRVPSVFIFVMFFLTGCSQDARSARGFSLPKGDVAEGRAAFLALNCNLCHSVADIEQIDALADDLPSPR